MGETMRRFFVWSVAVFCLAMLAGCADMAQGSVTITEVKSGTDIKVIRYPDCSSNMFTLVGDTDEIGVVTLRTLDQSSVKPSVATTTDDGVFQLSGEAQAGIKTTFEIVQRTDRLIASIETYGVNRDTRDCSIF